ncbi:MAG: OmpA family protein [Bacteroidetes bacterium]|nr:OmpA family protein [Bacteroidota bacterium]
MNQLRFLQAIMLLLVTITASGQARKNLNNWFIGGTVGTTFTHMDTRSSGFSPMMDKPFNYFGYSLAPEFSYHFTHGLGAVVQYNYANIRGDEAGKSGWNLRSFNTDLRELKFMAHINFGQALSFNKRRNMVNPYVNVGVGPTWGQLNLPIINNSDEYATHLLAQDGFLDDPDNYFNNPDIQKEPIKWETWNKNIQAGFYFYGNRYFDFDIRYNYTFYNEDYVDGSAIKDFINREWDKYSSISVGGKFKFGVNNRRTYEHTSWARPLIEEDTSLFNNLVLMEEYDDGLGNTVFKMRPGNTYNQEELTKIDNKSSDDDMYQAIYNTLMNNPDLRDSLMKSIVKDLTQNDAFIVNISDNVCENCKPQYVDGTKYIIREDGSSSTNKERNRNDGVGNENRRVTPPPGYNGPDEFELENIYYDLDKYYIREDAQETLDDLVKVLKKYPTLKIELGSHTDCRNTKAYNLWLSQKRAEAAINYLECKGIDKCRLVATGYGESKLVNDCGCEGDDVDKDCSEAEHQRNRRTMVRILDYNYQKTDGCNSRVTVDSDAAQDAKLNSKKKTYEGDNYVVTDEKIKAAGISKTNAAGYYVIVGTSSRPDYASSFAGRVKDEGNADAGIFYRKDDNYWIYMKRFDNYEDALKVVNDQRCCGKYPDAWVHVYNK